MSLITPPRVEGTVKVRDGRRMSFAEFGPASGRAIFWLHGTPGARRQIPEGARLAAEDLHVRFVGVDRPGVGDSTPHLYPNIADFAEDLALVADDLDIDRFAVIGLSGGGPYALGCAARLPERVVACAILGGVAPTQGPDAAPGGLVSVAARLGFLITPLHVPLAIAFTGFVWALRPVAAPALEVYARLSPEGDRRVFSRPEMKAMFIDDLVGNSKAGIRAPVYDLVQFIRDWGFRLAEVKVPVRWWHGDADHIVPLAHGQHIVDRLPDATLTVRPGESHLGGFGAAEEVLGTLLELWDRETPKNRRQASGR